VTDSGIKALLKADMTETFSNEKAGVCDENSGVIGIKVMKAETMVGFFTLHETANPAKLLLKICAVDQDRKKRRIMRKTLRFIFGTFPAINSIVTAVRNESAREKAFLSTKYKFKQVDEAIPGYDPELYTVFKIKRKQQS